MADTSFYPLIDIDIVAVVVEARHGSTRSPSLRRYMLTNPVLQSCEAALLVPSRTSPVDSN
jgi:hypothetical protein